MKWFATLVLLFSSFLYAKAPLDDFFLREEIRNIALPFTDVEDIIVKIPASFEYASSQINEESISMEFFPVKEKFDASQQRKITITLYPPSTDFEGFAQSLKSERDRLPRQHSNLVFGKKNCVKTFHLYVESQAFDEATNQVIPNRHESCLICGIDTAEGLYTLEYSICYEKTISNKEKNHLLEQLDSFMENDVYYEPK